MKKEIYKITMADGLLKEGVIANVFYNYLEPNEEIPFSGINHIEFIGKAVSETGYHSHFFYPDKLENKTVEEYLTEFLNNNSLYGKVESITKII